MKALARIGGRRTRRSDAACSTGEETRATSGDAPSAREDTPSPRVEAPFPRAGAPTPRAKTPLPSADAPFSRAETRFPRAETPSSGVDVSSLFRSLAIITRINGVDVRGVVRSAEFGVRSSLRVPPLAPLRPRSVFFLPALKSLNIPLDALFVRPGVSVQADRGCGELVRSGGVVSRGVLWAYCPTKIWK